MNNQIRDQIISLYDHGVSANDIFDELDERVGYDEIDLVIASYEHSLTEICPEEAARILGWGADDILEDSDYTLGMEM